MKNDGPIPALYNPITRMIGCVLLQAVYRGSIRVAHTFSTEDWEVDPVPGQTIMKATEGQWQSIANMTREERVTRWKAYT
jgi:hypothetical protein